jgi:hypothetical protein
MKGTPVKPSHALPALALLAAALQAAPAVAAPDKINHCQTITQSGSYVVTKNLNAVGDCIVVKADFVTIDLDGFVLEGNGTGGGITDQGGVSTVTNFSNGISLTASTGVVERITSAGNTNVGIVMVSGIVRDSTATGNVHNTGISVGPRSLVTGCNSTGNDVGIGTNIGTTIIGNTVGLNVRHGIVMSGNGTIVNNTSNNNPQTGIHAECPSVVVGNTAVSNGTNFNLVGAGCAADHNAGP